MEDSQAAYLILCKWEFPLSLLFYAISVGLLAGPALRFPSQIQAAPSLPLRPPIPLQVPGALTGAGWWWPCGRARGPSGSSPAGGCRMCWGSGKGCRQAGPWPQRRLGCPGSVCWGPARAVQAQASPRVHRGQGEGRFPGLRRGSLGRGAGTQHGPLGNHCAPESL